MLFRKWHVLLKIYIGDILIYQLLGIILIVVQESKVQLFLFFLFCPFLVDIQLLQTWSCFCNN